MMLLQFRAKNYKSIGDEIVLDMMAGSGSEHKDFLIEENGVKILPVASIYGSNASGKSNVIDAIGAMFYNIVDSYRFGEKDRIDVIPFLYNPSLRENPTEFEVFLAIGAYEYQYGFKATKDKVLEEWLFQRKLSKNCTVSQMIFERNESRIVYNDISKVKYTKLEEYNSLIGDKMLALSFLGNKYTEQTQVFNDIFDWSSNFSMSEAGNKNLQTQMGYAAELYYRHEDVKENFVVFVKEFDSSLEDIVIKKELTKEGEEKLRIFTVHNGGEYPIGMESDGTKKLFAHFSNWFIDLNVSRGVSAIDELDSQLHPLILRRIVNMYHDKNMNKMGSQLIFSSHNLIVLDNKELRRDEIWFTEKDERGFTNLFSLAEFKANEKDIRSDMNYGKNYLAGRFGAIPFLNHVEENMDG